MCNSASDTKPSVINVRLVGTPIIISTKFIEDSADKNSTIRSFSNWSVSAYLSVKEFHCDKIPKLIYENNNKITPTNNKVMENKFLLNAILINIRARTSGARF